MTLTPATAPIAAELARLSDADVRRLASDLEAGRARGAPDPAMPRLFAVLRPRLRALADPVPRTPTPLRILCGAAEELLCDAPDVPGPGWVRRSAVQRLGQWLAAGPLAEAWSHAEEALRLAAATGAVRSATRAAAALRDAFAGALDPLADDPPPALADARGEIATLAACVRHRGELDALRTVLPRAIEDLGADHVTHIRAVYDALDAKAPNQAALALHLVRGRMIAPWRVLRLPQRLAGVPVAEAAAAPGYADLADAALADVTQRVGGLVALRLDRAPPMQAADLLDAAIMRLLGLQDEVARAGDSGRLAQLVRLGARLSDALRLAGDRLAAATEAGYGAPRLGRFGQRAAASAPVAADGDVVARLEMLEAAAARLGHAGALGPARARLSGMPPRVT